MSRLEQKFFRSTMQHFASLRNPGFAPSANPEPFPPGWFDLGQETLADFGALYFLMSLSQFNRHRTLADITNQLEPPLRLGQYRIFRSGGHPRAFITWAGLSPQAERAWALSVRRWRHRTGTVARRSG